jgi:hypothetical protein
VQAVVAGGGGGGGKEKVQYGDVERNRRWKERGRTGGTAATAVRQPQEDEDGGER